LLQNIDELYISTPYFIAEEAGKIKNALVVLPLEQLYLSHHADFEEEEDDEGMETQENESEQQNREKKEEGKEMTAKQAIKTLLSGFLEKRKASCDSRPCGPHDLAPVYEAVFEIQKIELEEEGVLGEGKEGGFEG
jgi:hypothetical protein